MKDDKKIEFSKQKALEVVFAQISKTHGSGSIMFLGKACSDNVEFVSTGSLLINDAIGAGGFPRGRVVEIYGPEASGKTTLALHAIAEAQKKGGVCAFIDAEHALDPIYSKKLGINTDDLIISQPDYGEQALDIAEMLIRSNAVDLIVVDSVAALVPKAELEGEMGDHHVGLQARLMSQALRKLTPVVHKSRSVLIFINQIRHNINAMAFANKEVTTGGKALKFYSSLRVEVRRICSIKDSDGLLRGNRVRVKISKNKMAPPFRMVEVDLIFGEGINRILDLIDAALLTGVVSRSGSWFYFGAKKIAQGRDQAARFLRSHMSMARSIEEKVLKKFQEKRDGSIQEGEKASSKNEKSGGN